MLVQSGIHYAPICAIAAKPDIKHASHKTIMRHDSRPGKWRPARTLRLPRAGRHLPLPAPLPKSYGQAFSLTTATSLTRLRMDIWTTLQVDHMTTLSLAPCVFQFEDTEEDRGRNTPSSVAHTSVDNQRLATPLISWMLDGGSR